MTENSKVSRGRTAQRRRGPGCSITLTDEETSFVSFIMGTYVGLLMRHKGKLDRGYRAARAVSMRVMKKINASAAEKASWTARMTALRAATVAYLENKTVNPRDIGLTKKDAK